MHDEQQSSIKPHLIIIAVVAIVLVVIFFWPSDDQVVEDTVSPIEVVEQPSPVVENIPEVEAPPEPETITDTFEATPVPESVELDADQEIEPLPEPEIIETEAEPEPVDISDAAIESALITLANNNFITDLLINESMLQRFVVTVTNLANEEMAPNHRLVKVPEKRFRVYQQADRYWIDPASYKRYTAYTNALESLDNQRLISLYERYQSDIVNTYEEISSSRQSFNQTFIDAIDTLLDTPEVPMPVEVFTDSVVYKYKDERLENLSAPQKQLLRTGPDNMRRIKAKLRELKTLLLEKQ